MAANDEEFTLDVSEFRDALILYESTTNRDMADVINFNARKICFLAAKKTPKATASSINNHKPKKRKGEYKHGLFHALASGGKTKYGKAVRGEGNRDVALKIFNSRKSALGYSKQIWYSIAADLGAKLRGKFNVKGAKGIAAKSTNPVAWLDTGNMDIALRDAVMVDALNSAIREVSKDIARHAQGKLDKTAAKYSAR
tara:strand:+ start:17019 stop:17612 length:594 start_codon:yes stop_codon:yes gene_type:complete